MTETLANLDTLDKLGAMNRLEWTIGHEGKGFICTDGSVWTWNTENLRPMHWQKNGQAKHLGLTVRCETAFHICPDGEVWQFGEGRKLTWDDQNLLMYTACHLHFDPFRAPSVETDGYGHANRLLELLV